MRALAAILAAAALVGLSGCLSPWTACEEPGPWTLVTPEVAGSFLRTDPQQAWDTLVLDVGHAGPGNVSLWSSARPAGWSVASQRLSPAGELANFSLLRVMPGPGEGSLEIAYELADEVEGSCKIGHGGKVTWPLQEPQRGDQASPGQGAHVLTAGFWENGTLFYTNIAELDTDPAWPKAGWYTWEGADPLPVYVYDEDRAEQPAHWTDLQAGTPIEGTLAGVGYFTTIPGFNAALKGLSTTTTRVVHLAPEEGYTRPGNEDHPLYGDALVFYIQVLDVVDFPCPLWVDADYCRLPEAPLAGAA